AAAVAVGGRRTPVERLLVAGRERLIPAAVQHIEIKADAPRFILHRVGQAHIDSDPGALELAGKQQRELLLVAVRREDLEAERLAALAVDQIRPAQRVAGSVQQAKRATQDRAVAPRAIADRRRPGPVHYVG